MSVTKSAVKMPEASLLVWRSVPESCGTMGNQVFCSLHR